MNHLADRLPPDNSGSHGQTRFWRRVAVVPNGGWDVPDSRGTCDMPVAPPLSHRGARRGTCARNRRCPWTSRVSVEVAVSNLGKRIRVSLKFRFDPIHQCGEGRARSGVADHLFPRGVTIQFRDQTRQILRQFFALVGRERADGCLNFLNRTHGLKVLKKPTASKS
jgi:hypothetical protein